MTLSKDTLKDIARDYFGRELDESAAQDAATRVRTLLAWISTVDQGRAQSLEPSAVFAPGDVAWDLKSSQAQLLPGKGAWETVGSAGPGGSGYGMPPGQAVADRVKAEPAAPAASAAPTTPPTPPASTAVPPPPAPQPVGLPVPSLLAMSLSETVARVRRKEISPVELVRAALDRMAELNPKLTAFITVLADQALDQARRAEEAIAQGRAGSLGPLAGVPVGVKDIIRTAGVRTTCGSRLLADYVPDEDATVVRRLRSAGAIMVGKTNTHEFAFGATGVNPHYGASRNPWDPKCVSGGSSGGSAVAVATGMVFAALGTDTGGSIRIPAAACGAVGLKPTYGRISKHGIFPLSWSLDHAGPITRTVRDAALLLQILAGPDPLDASTAVRPVPDYSKALDHAATESLKGLKLGVPRSWLETRIEAGVRARFEDAVKTLADLGADVVETDYPPADPMMLANRLLALAEAAAYHAPFLKDRAHLYGADVRARFEMGQYIMARDYILGQRLRGEIAWVVARAMSRVDAVIMPTLPVVAPLIGQDFVEWPEGAGQGEAAAAAREAVPDALIRFTAPINVTGQPVISVPCGLAGPGPGLPVGLQIVGRAFDEETVLRVAAAFEAARG